jgi:hypothetical protein
MGVASNPLHQPRRLLQIERTNVCVWRAARLRLLSHIDVEASWTFDTPGVRIWLLETGATQIFKSLHRNKFKIIVNILITYLII